MEKPTNSNGINLKETPASTPHSRGRRASLKGEGDDKKMMDRHQQVALDRYITGNYGEDQFPDEPEEKISTLAKSEVKDSPEIQELKAELSQCIGSQNWYRHFTGVLYTDGIKLMAEKANAHWLIDVIASYQGEAKVKKEPFQVWELVVKEKQGVVTMKPDSDRPVVVSQELKYTDFPEGTLKLYVEEGGYEDGKMYKCILLLSEH